jgi:hypothetical protein
MADSKHRLRDVAKFVAQALVGGYVVYSVQLIATGIGVLAGLVATLATDLPATDSVVLFVGVALVSSGVVAIVSNIFVPETWLRPRRPIKAPSIQQAKEQERENRERRYRVIAQEALTTLEYQRGFLVDHRIDFNPEHQGVWPLNRDTLFEEERHANAGRLTESAFIAIQAVPSVFHPADPLVLRAIAAIDAAIPALETVAGIKH